ncbi:hypothetical protein GCM10009601_16070 [Streptomyces thermospinosisporus]|uniref:Uncharacterized protein n=1 Tax=Streptomyces thermospinosisporus TaxID=161482 RepID=A0ABP4JDJ7_9ACTN
MLRRPGNDLDFRHGNDLDFRHGTPALGAFPVARWRQSMHEAYARADAAEGARLHCSPMAPRVHCEVAFDWLQETLK